MSRSATAPHPTVRWVTMLGEQIAAAVLMAFPFMRLEFPAGIAVEQTFGDVLANSAWALLYQLLQIAFVVSCVAAVLPLFVRQVRREPLLLVLIITSSLMLTVNIGLYVLHLVAGDHITYYGLSLRAAPPTVTGLLYAVTAAFAVVESILAYRALRREKEDEPLED